ncbi:MAG: chemotaxis protein CheC [Candidatus Omnitrophota bacterium]
MDIFELDVLREISTIAAGYGSTALLQLLGKKIHVSLPTVASLEAEEFVKTAKAQGPQQMVSMQCDITSGLEGRVIIMLDETSALKLVNICYPNQIEIQQQGLASELSQSILKEVGDIVVGSYVKALTLFLDSTITSSIPTVLRGPQDQLVKAAVTSGEKLFVVIIDTVFEERKEKIKGRMGFILTQKDKNMISTNCRKKLDDLEK